MAITTYRNPWHKAGKPEYGPAEYSTTATPTTYRGYLIYQRIKGVVWDVVKDGACITQLAGPNGARRAIDQLCELREKETNPCTFHSNSPSACAGDFVQEAR